MHTSTQSRGAPNSLPISWHSLQKLVGGKYFNILKELWYSVGACDGDICIIKDLISLIQSSVDVLVKTGALVKKGGWRGFISSSFVINQCAIFSKWTSLHFSVIFHRNLISHKNDSDACEGKGNSRWHFHSSFHFQIFLIIFLFFLIKFGLLCEIPFLLPCLSLFQMN